jgi:hypothetical protein
MGMLIDNMMLSTECLCIFDYLDQRESAHNLRNV